MTAASATVRVMGPTWLTVPKGEAGQVGTRPKVGFMPTMPVKPAGIRIEPPPSEPWCSAPMPRAAATAAPPEEPPAVRLVSQGLRATSPRGLSVTPFQPNSGVVVLPRITAPASRNRATGGESTGSGATPSVVRLPRRVGKPFIRLRSLTVAGTPSIGPRGRPSRQRASLARAASRAPSASTRVKAPTSPFHRSIRARQARVASTGERAPRRNRRTSSWAEKRAGSVVDTGGAPGASTSD